MDAKCSYMIDMVLCGGVICCFPSEIPSDSVSWHSVSKGWYPCFILQVLGDELKRKA